VTRSEYSDLALDGRQLRIDQLAPTIGFGFAERRDWLQLRAYLISASIPSLAAGEKDSTALELKWTHWPIGGGLLGLNNYRFSLTAGDRMFAVDPDAGSVYNLAEVQTGSLSIGGEWAPSDRNRIMLLLGTEQYENQSLGRDYSSAFVYLNLSHRWE
jgi:hypothetical protein